jgi:hypothetical protein
MSVILFHICTHELPLLCIACYGVWRKYRAGRNDEGTRALPE